MKRLLPFLKPYKKLLFIGPFFKLLEAIFELFLPFLMSKIIDNGVMNRDKAYILQMGGLMVVIALFGIISALICQYSASLVSQGVGTDIRNRTFEQINSFSNREMDQFGTASLINRVTNDVNQVQLAVAMLIRLVIRAPFLCIGGLIMTFMIDSKIAMILLLILPIFILILYITMKQSVPLYRIVQEKLDSLSLVLRENLGGIRVIRAFTREDYEKERFAYQNKEYSNHAIRVGKISALLNPLTSLIMNFGIGAILWWGGIRVYSGSMTTGEVIAFIGYITQILAALIVISNLVVIFTKAFASAGRIAEILNTKNTLESGHAADSTFPGDKSEPIISFDNVSFTYGKKKEYDISDITFQIKRGETIGIIGGTGSGKSTLIQLIPRFYDAGKGSVFIDGIPVKEYDIHALRKKIGIVPQKAVLFSGTVEENLKWGDQNVQKEEIEEAARTAMAHDFIIKLKNGYQTRVERGGKNFSGGQRQRLTIARALVRKPEILILDDSFHALDYLTDASLRKALKKYTSDMTTLIVSQRVSTIQGADQIFVMHDGRLVGIGTHNELRRDCPIYKEICLSQMQEKEVAVL